MASLRIGWKFFAWSLSIAGCFYQLFRISDSYFDRETVNRVIINRSNYVTPPKIVACQHDSDFRPNLFKHPNLTIPKLFNDTLDKGKILRNSVFFYHTPSQSDHHYQIHGEHINVSKHFKNDGYVCYSISLASNITAYTPAVKDINPVQNAILQFFLENIFLSGGEWYLFTIPRELDLYGGDENAMTLITTESLMMISITYEYYRTQLLPFPYKTNCRDYNEVGKQSRAHAWQSCFDDCIYGSFTRYPTLSLIRDDEEKLVIPMYPKHKATQERCIGECNQKKEIMKPDCVTEVYVSSLRTCPVGMAYRSIGLTASSRPSIIALSIPAIDIVDYVTYVLSCFSFWFAFSPLVLLTEGTAYEWIAKKFDTEQDISNATTHAATNHMKCEEAIYLLGQDINYLKGRLATQGDVEQR